MADLEAMILERLAPVVKDLVRVAVEERVQEMETRLVRVKYSPVVDAGELSAIIGMSKNSIHRKVALRELPTVLRHGNRYFDLGEIYEMADECNFRNAGKVRDAIDRYVNGNYSNSRRANSST